MQSEHGTVIFQKTSPYYGNQDDWYCIVLYCIHKRPILRISQEDVRFEVLREMNIKISVLWDVTPCSLAEVPACQRMPLLKFKRFINLAR